MSRRMLLGRAGVVTNTTTTTAATTTTTRARAAFALPTLSDQTVMQMRPSLPPLASYVVALDGSGDFTSINEACRAARQVQTSAAGSVGARTPRHRVDIGVKPGKYVEMVTQLDGFLGVYALDGNRGGTTTLTNPYDGSPPGGVLAPTNSLYWEGIDLTDSPSANGYDPKYPVHNSGVGTQIYTRMQLWNNAPNSGGGRFTFGMDGINVTLVFHDVTMKDGGCNLHGSDRSDVAQPETIVWSKVTGGYAGSTVQFADLDMGTADDLWLVDCNFVEFRNLTSNGAATVHVSPSTVIQGGAGPKGKVDQRTDWPVPVGGISARERAQYGIAA